MTSLSSFFDEKKLLLAPMAGFSDAAFRRICCEQGADIAYSEMVSAKGLEYLNDKTFQLLELDSQEKKVAVQIFGHEPSVMAKEAGVISEKLASSLFLIDVNMGCPARKIVSKGDGSALMKNPALAKKIIKEIKMAVDVPVTCKFRRSWDATGEYINAVEFAQHMQEGGADGVCIHGRYATQMYNGSSDRNCIRLAKEKLSIPVIGNGDVFNAQDALDLFEETSCDGVMIARGARGNPWIFSQTKALLKTSGPIHTPSPLQRTAMLRHHLRLEKKLRGDHLEQMRKHAMFYVKGIPGASVARNLFSKCTTLDDFEQVLDRLEETINAA